MMSDDSTEIVLYFLMLRFFFDFTANLARVMETQLAKKSSSAFLRAFLKGSCSWSSFAWSFRAASSTTIVSVP